MSWCFGLESLPTINIYYPDAKALGYIASRTTPAASAHRYLKRCLSMAIDCCLDAYRRLCGFGILFGQNGLLGFMEGAHSIEEYKVIMSSPQTSKSIAMPRWRQYWVLTKPRVTQLAVFCAVIGMFLATPGMVPYPILIGGVVGIWLLASAAFAVNCLIEQAVDAKMKRTSWRPSATGEVTPFHIIIFSIILGSLGMIILWNFCNPLTMWLTLATFVGYAVIYTWLLKPATPQNIVIGGLSGAMPPALGWAAVTNTLSAEAWLLVLIIFVWTPPHFWALALYRRDDYVQSGLPMLPVTHGERFTLLNILLYTLILIAATLLPYVYGMSGMVYLISAIILGLIFLAYAIALFVSYSDALAKKTFRFSITYLSLLFVALLVDHYFL
jgi:protoheme IX farnesyltransferase